MTCSESVLLLPDLEAGRLSAGDARRVRGHLETCAACSRELELQRRLDLVIKEERAPAPGPHMHAAFHAWLETETQAIAAPRQVEPGVIRVSFWNRPATISALVALAACAIFAVGLTVGARLPSSAAPAGPDTQTAAELASLRDQISVMREAVTWTMLQQPNAGDRLQAVRTIASGAATPAAVNELLGVVAYDTSGQVRESAVQALYRHADAPTVRTAVARALGREPSPAVQLAMIDLLAATRDPEAAAALESLVRNENQHQLVREAANYALTRM